MELARRVEQMVVVGGRSSANTRELTRLCEIAGTPVLQIESAADLADAAAFGAARVVGVSGGTSTPIEDLEAVAARIYELAGTPAAQVRARHLAREAAAGRGGAGLPQHSSIGGPRPRDIAGAA